MTVLLDYTPDALDVQVVDDGRGASAALLEPGHGLRGMRERAEALGGSLTAASGGDGGFVVSARLPLATVAGPR